ncbi:hypothetical protein ACIRRA_12230 [Nocardia sp. NPDC101769]|uniref:hypothetical protein n=1 Tax=Nocardia sp. NPDC101769 TaxID=3364333 RepID=UPI00382961EB
MPSAITLHNLSFEWPDGTVALSGLNGTLSTGRTGLVGRNGAGHRARWRWRHAATRLAVDGSKPGPAVVRCQRWSASMIAWANG